ncbi:PREDICTED: uncharacterized protein LOC103326337 [Prunus mume]|uniref:Uncharacterized protein LOC103326337 n=1 Tax=Prunus mume TaxID=102107 RepID=A0ABM0NLZ5_PRUMU|nr:PREDICTED: uncharacterized protein LOC103326337 [Prunus mume]
MVLDITVERDPDVNDIGTDAYTVHVESHRILTVATFSEATVTKWLKQVFKFTKSTILVGVAAEVDNTRGWLRKKDPPYDMLCLTIGCHCLIYQYFDDKPAGLLVSFLANPRVFAVGRDMANLCRKLKTDHGIEIRNAVDVNDLAVRGLGRDDLDLGRYGLDRLAKTVLGKKMDVVRPEEELFWHGEYESFWSMNCEVVKFCTVDVYLCYLIGLELIDAIDGAADLKKMKKKKKNKKDK